MLQPELLKRVVAVLDEVGIEYMITGSIASSLQGEPRSTHDIDIVVFLQKSQVQQLVTKFPASDFYLDQQSILQAIDNEGMFNMIDRREGDKVDFWILTDQLFDQSRFSRKYLEEFLDMEILVSRSEDTILAKLRWMKLSGGSEKQFTDAVRVYEVQYSQLDQEYLNQWAQKLGIEAEFKKLQNEARVIEE